MSEHNHLHDRTVIMHVLSIALLLKVVAASAQFLGCYLSGSLALFSDSVHLLFDIFVNLVGWVAVKVGQKAANETDQMRTEARGAQIIAFTLMATSLYIFYETWQRSDPTYLSHVHGNIMFPFALFGLGINCVNIFLFHTHKHTSLIKYVRAHEISDFVSSCLVVAAGVGVWRMKDPILDVVASFIIGCMIFIWSALLLREAHRRLH